MGSCADLFLAIWLFEGFLRFLVTAKSTPELDSILDSSSPDSSSLLAGSIPDKSSPKADSIPDKLGKIKLRITVNNQYILKP